jgi:hypothetical protein
MSAVHKLVTGGFDRRRETRQASPLPCIQRPSHRYAGRSKDEHRLQRSRDCSRASSDRAPTTLTGQTDVDLVKDIKMIRRRTRP